MNPARALAFNDLFRPVHVRATATVRVEFDGDALRTLSRCCLHLGEFERNNPCLYPCLKVPK
jgi:hypothetical protein